MTERTILSFVAEQRLLKAAKWSRFLAIMGGVFAGIALINAMGLTIRMGRTGRWFGEAYLLDISYVLLALMCFFPFWQLYHFGKETETALQTLEENRLDKAFEHLSQFFRLLTFVLAGFALIYFAGGIALRLFF